MSDEAVDLSPIVPTEPPDYKQVQLLTKLLFSEVDKGKRMEVDAPAVAHVALNRVGGRWGNTLEEVVFAPKQFSGVGTKEWNKADKGDMTAEEFSKYKRLYSIASGAIRGTIPDPTGGANHYFNPKLVKPSWSKGMKNTYTSDAHDFYVGK